MPVMEGTAKDAAIRLKGDFVAVVKGVIQVADALSALHSQKSVHRDVNPGVAFRDDGAEQTTTRAVSKDWFPRWYDDHLGHSTHVDVYMLGALSFYLLTADLKPLDPTFLTKPRFDLPALFPEAQGAREVFEVLKSVVVSDPATMTMTNGAELARALRQLLPLVENSDLHKVRVELQRLRAEPKLILDHSAAGNDQGDAVSLQRAAVWIPNDCESLTVWINSKHEDSFALDIVSVDNTKIHSTSPTLSNYRANNFPVPDELRGSWRCLCLRASGSAVGTGRVTRLSVYANSGGA
jgi:hypothetical protein